MTRKTFRKIGQFLLLLVITANVSSCSDPQVYGSIGVSSYSGGGSRVSGGISIGGRIR